MSRTVDALGDDFRAFATTEFAAEQANVRNRKAQATVDMIEGVEAST